MRNLPPEQLRAWLATGAIVSTWNHEIILGIGPARRVSAPPSHGETAFYAPDFFLEDRAPWIVFEQTIQIDFDSLQGALRLIATSDAQWNFESASEAEFCSAFEDLTKAFHEGRLKKGVPVAFETARMKMDAPVRANLLTSILQYAAPLPVHVYGFWDRSEGIVGATPEVLVSRATDGTWTTMALAGTRRDNDVGRLPLLDDPKEMREHALVIEGIQESLASRGVHAHAGTIGELRLPGLTHLRTPVSLSFDSGSEPPLTEWIQALHPTPALGAFPREEGMRWLRSLDARSALQRMRFGAPFGFVEKDRALITVAIRNLQWRDDLVQLGAGCGVIAESEAAREWLEIQAKLRAIKGILGVPR